MKNTGLNFKHIAGTSCFLSAIIFLYISSATFVAGAEKNNSVVITAIQNEQTHAIAKEVVREAYRKIGYSVRFDFFPSTRSLEMANAGESDGDVARIEGTQKEFPNLIPIPVPVIWFDGVVFTKNITKRIIDWKDLKGLRVGIIRGIRYSDIGTKGLSPYFAENMTHLFKLLDQDMIQVAIAVLMAGKIEIAKNFNGSGIHPIGKPLYTGRLYHYVNREQQHLVPELFSVLQKMEIQGESQEIIDTTFHDMIKK